MRVTPGYRWWKPLLSLIMAVVLFLISQLLFVIPFLIAMFSARPSPESDGTLWLQELTDGIQGGGYNALIPSNPLSIILVTGSLILLMPTLALSLRAVGLGKLGSLSSTEGHLRRERLGVFLGIALALVLLIGFLLPWVLGMADGGSLDIPSPHIVPAALVAIVILVPLQSAAEEYAFRGFLMQVLGSWIPLVWIPILIQAAIFTIGHPYDLKGQLVIICMGLMMGFLAMRLGGLEATIAFHVANNFLSFLMGSLFSTGSTSGSVDTMSLVLSVMLYLLYARAILLVARRRGWLALDPPDFAARVSRPPAPLASGASRPPVPPHGWA